MTPFQEHLNRASDIQQHLGLLHGLACRNDVESVVELGFRTGVSTSAFLAAGVHVYSVDIDPGCRPHVQRLAKVYPDTFVFKVGDSTSNDHLQDCDLLFIDTDHTYATTMAELDHWNGHVNTWIVLHDTVSFGRIDRPPGKGAGVMSAVDDFLTLFDEWMQWLHLPNNNGLTILKRR